jgi:excinuclease ABC subunit A
MLGKTTKINPVSIGNPVVEDIENLPVAIALEQQIPPEILRLTIGEFAGINDILISLFVTLGKLHCPDCGEPVEIWTPSRIADEIFKRYPYGTRFYVAAPLGLVPHSKLSQTVQELTREGFIRFIIDGKVVTTDNLESIGWRKEHEFFIVIDRFVVEEGTQDRLADSSNTALETSNRFGERPLRKVLIIFPEGNRLVFSDQPVCYRCGRFYEPLSIHLFDSSHPAGQCPSCNASGCGECHGTGRNPLIFKVLLREKTFPQLSSLPLGHFAQWIESFDSPLKVGLLRSCLTWLKSVHDFRIDYLSLDRKLFTLSAGELQKLRLIELWRQPLTGILSVFDEPLKFLDQEERARLAERLRMLTSMDQTIIIVDHHPDAAKMADHVIELGPGSGKDGGKVTWEGMAEHYDLSRMTVFNPQSPPPLKKQSDPKSNNITIKGATGHNLKNVSVSFPVKALTLVTGPVGSGKTTLVFETFVPALKRHYLNKPAIKPLPYQDLKCSHDIATIVTIREKMAITKPSERSILATFLNIFTPIRQFYAQLAESKKKGFKIRHFSWNTPEGSCNRCNGRGVIIAHERVGVNPEIPCPICDGKRYRREILTVKYKGYSISDVLQMGLDEASRLFHFLAPIQNILETVKLLNISHLIMGQPLSTLSGGELHRVWIIRQLALSESMRGDKIFCFDQPTAGLHSKDIESLLCFWHRLIANGHTVIVCDSNDSIADSFQWIIALGPGGGPEGGNLMYEGTARNWRTNDRQ